MKTIKTNQKVFQPPKCPIAVMVRKSINKNRFRRRATKTTIRAKRCTRSRRAIRSNATMRSTIRALYPPHKMKKSCDARSWSSAAKVVCTYSSCRVQHFVVRIITFHFPFRRINMKGLLHHAPTNEDISNILKEFTVDFLLKGYGYLVQDLHSKLLSEVDLVCCIVFRCCRSVQCEQTILIPLLSFM